MKKAGTNFKDGGSDGVEIESLLVADYLTALLKGEDTHSYDTEIGNVYSHQSESSGKVGMGLAKSLINHDGLTSLQSDINNKQGIIEVIENLIQQSAYNPLMVKT